ncbi:hypothetical protein KAI46_04160, partial [bacterium]|nr:hypothetical protein [bacterium]
MIKSCLLQATPDQEGEIRLKNNNTENVSKFALGLSKLRQRRCFFWGVLLVYVPVIWLSLQLTNSDRQTAKVFAVWFLFLFISSILTTTGKCPRCRKFFHLNGFIPLFLRRCL